MKKIVDILKEIHPETDFERSDDFIRDELLDSFDVIELVSGLEEAFGITIDGLDILPENFNSLENIEKMIVKSGGVL